MAEEKITCPICGSKNPPGTEKCVVCDTELVEKQSVSDEEIDALLSDIFSGETTEGEEDEDFEEEGLSLALEDEMEEVPEEEEFDEDMLESLLLDAEEEEAGEVEVFECPLCGTPVSVDATVCPGCNASFVEEEEPEYIEDDVFNELETLIDEDGEAEIKSHEPEIRTEEVPVEAVPERKPPVKKPEPKVKEAEVAPRPTPTPPRERAPEVERVPATKPVPQPSVRKDVTIPSERKTDVSGMEVTEAKVPILHKFGTRVMDITVAATCLIILGIFVINRMYLLENWTLFTTLLIFIIGLVGFSVAYVFYIIGNSFLVKGDEYYLDGKYDKALDHYEKAIRFGSRPSSSAWTNRGSCYRHLGYLEEALKSHEIALKIDERDEIAWANKGATLLSLGDIQGAIEAYNRSLSLRPNYVVALNNKGVAMASLNDLNSAQYLFKKAIQVKPRYRAAWINLAEAMARLGKSGESQKALANAQKIR